MNEPTIKEVVANDLCIACGLCESVSQGRVRMAMTDAGSLRPTNVDDLSPAEHEVLQKVCPGIVAEARIDPNWKDQQPDPIWGSFQTMELAWAGHPEVRHRSATGGVLTAVGQYLIDHTDVVKILHVGADPAAPMRSVAQVSRTAQQVLDNAGSRYGPVAPFTLLAAELAKDEPFAVIAKPCDLGALHRYAQLDPRVDEWCRARLTMVCGGSSRLSKSLALLDEFEVSERQVTLFRYRGYGNPGPTVVETEGGQRHSKTYLELWEDESSWQIETRCKLCPDALGEAADIAAADAWPGGAPTGEDEGFNAVVVRSMVGEQLYRDAVDAGYLVRGDDVTPRQFDDLQPHQVRKKEALAARYQGMRDAGVSPIATVGLRVDELGSRLDADSAEQQRAGTERRMQR